MMLKWALSFRCSDGSSVACCEATAGGLCVESPAVHWDAVPLHACPSSLSSCPSSPSLCSCVCLFALPNYPLGTIKIDWTGLCGLRMNDRLSVAGVMRSHCRRTCRPSQLSICLPVLLSESVKLSASPPLLHRLGVALLVSLSPPLMSSCLSVCPQLLSLLLSPLVCPHRQVLFIFNSQTLGFFTAEREREIWICWFVFITGHLREQKVINREPERLFLNGDPRKQLSSLSPADSRSQIGRFGKLHFSLAALPAGSLCEWKEMMFPRAVVHKLPLQCVKCFVSLSQMGFVGLTWKCDGYWNRKVYMAFVRL